MAELTQVLGTILKDVAHSRVISDAFSRDISVDYAKDPILVNFPVPRVEIREASIQLKFAVNAVQQGEVDREGIARDRLSSLASALSQRVYQGLILDSPQRDQLLAMLEEKGLDLPALLAAQITQITTKQFPLVLAAVQGKPQELIRQLEATLQESVRNNEALWAILKKSTRVQDLRERISAAVTPAVNDYVAGVGQAIDTAGREGLRVDVAVTRNELADTPESVLSFVSIVTEIRNYAWTQVGGTEEQPIWRLQAE